ncbi:MAG: hypothetical protein LBR85_08130 [Oscillospiraceae bacterium]|nr:hypothetical protein [Oscillospiraceae bacterium]
MVRKRAEMPQKKKLSTGLITMLTIGIMAVAVVIIFVTLPPEESDPSVMTKLELEQFDTTVWNSLYGAIATYGNIKTAGNNWDSDRVYQDELLVFCAECEEYLAAWKAELAALLETESREPAPGYIGACDAFYDSMGKVVGEMRAQAQTENVDDRVPAVGWENIADCDALLLALREVRLEFVKPAEFSADKQTKLEREMDTVIQSAGIVLP